MEEIKKIVKEIRDNKELSSFDESATKQVIILRILNTLGWDIYNRKEVFPEYGEQGKKVDYSLRHNDENKVFIEVKRIGEDLEKHQHQLLHYSFEEGVQLAILTNGLTWCFYLPILYNISWHQRKFYTIDLESQHVDEIAENFECYILKDNIISNKAYQIAEEKFYSKQKLEVIKEFLPQAFDKIISDPDEFFVDLLMEKTEELSGYKPEVDFVKNFLDEKITSQYFFKDTLTPKAPEKSSKLQTFQQEKERNNQQKNDVFKIEDLLKKDLNKTQPTELIIKNDKYDVKNWKDVSTKFVQWLVDHHYLEKNRLPVHNSARKGKYFINIKPKHHSGKKMEDFGQVQDVFIDTKYNASVHVKNIIATLEQLSREEFKESIQIKLIN